MQKTLAAATVAALVAVGGNAMAADMYSGGSLKDGPVAVAPDGGWTGFYLGVGAGGGFANHDVKADWTREYIDPSAEINGLASEGVFGTVEVGYDRQFGRWVGGIFFNYDFGDDIKTTANLNSLNASITLDDSWSVGGRVGYLINNDTLAYVLAAYTQANIDYSIASASKTLTPEGYTLGSGLELRLMGNWFVKGEYRFTQFDTTTLLSGRGFKITDETDVQSVRAILTYKADLFGHDYTPLK